MHGGTAWSSVVTPIYSKDARSTYSFQIPGKVLCNYVSVYWLEAKAEYAVSDHPLGDYIVMGDPCIDDVEQTTFRSQSTYVLPIDEAKGKFIYMGDRWTPDELGQSPHVWLPLTVDQEGNVSIRWVERWSLGNY